MTIKTATYHEIEFYYKDLLALPSDPIVLSSLDGLIHYKNEAAKKLLFKEETTNDTPSLIDISADLESICKEFFNGDRRPKLYKINIIPLQGKEKLARIFATDTGLGVAILDHQKTISNKKSIQAIKFFKSAIDNIADSCLLTLAEPLGTPGPIIIYANQAIISATGYSISELLGKSPRLFQGKESDIKTLNAFGRSLRSWKESRMEIINYKKDNSQHWVEIRASPSAIGDELYTHWISIQRDTSENVKDKQKLALDATTDSLTGLANRRHFIKELEQLSSEEKTHFALYYCDIDNFKQLNDGFGHEAGDHFLQQVGNCLNQSVRDGDLVARLGGDEFAVIAKRIDQDSAILELSRRINENTNNLSKRQSQAIASRVTISIGVVLKPSGKTFSAETLLQRADSAMYFSKINHKGCCTFYDDHLKKISSRANYVREIVGNHMGCGALAVAYQPLVDLSNGRIHGAEALVRIIEQKKGENIMPSEFIPIAELTGDIKDIELFCINDALTTLKKIQDLGLKRTISVNVSPAHINNVDISELIVRLNKQHGCDLTGLIVEITETVILKKSDQTITKLKKLKKHGIKIALDDFGTGYSSIEWLLGGLIDIVKLDVEFTRLIAHDKKARTVVKCLAQTCIELGIEVIAEGVETAEQHNLLQSIGYNVGQGYLFGKAQSSEFLLKA